jgi:hypothetical protein
MKTGIILQQSKFYIVRKEEEVQSDIQLMTSKCGMLFSIMCSAPWPPDAVITHLKVFKNVSLLREQKF